MRPPVQLTDARTSEPSVREREDGPGGLGDAALWQQAPQRTFLDTFFWTAHAEKNAISLFLARFPVLGPQFQDRMSTAESERDYHRHLGIVMSL